ncbi:hypothetical protein HK104_002058 [Borealophlyctis nickersoniae]|nr:hypothetical protein HK104_002058 [Borealophlyctis nickersoniae]
MRFAIPAFSFGGGVRGGVGGSVPLDEVLLSPAVEELMEVVVLATGVEEAEDPDGECRQWFDLLVVVASVDGCTEDFLGVVVLGEGEDAGSDGSVDA